MQNIDFSLRDMQPKTLDEMLEKLINMLAWPVQPDSHTLVIHMIQLVTLLKNTS